MARADISPSGATLTVPNTPLGVLTETALNASEFNSFINTGREYLVVRNSDASSHTVILRSSEGTQIGATYTIAAGKSAVLGPFQTFEDFGSTVLVDGNSALLLAYVFQISKFANTTR